MERLYREKPSGLNSSGLRTWGMLFLLLGAAGRGILQNRILGIGGASGLEMMESVLNADGAMTVATIALVCEAVETCAVPVFCFLLVEGFTRTSNFLHYLLRVLGAALISEIPYNFAMSGKLLDLGSRNPVFGMVLCLIMMFFYNRYSKKSFGNTVIKLCVTLAAIVWAEMLQVDSGSCCVIIAAVLWAFRKKPVYRNMMGCVAAGICCLISPFYLAAPMSFLTIHFYNGEKGAENRVVNYLVYPVMLLVIGLVGAVAI